MKRKYARNVGYCLLELQSWKNFQQPTSYDALFDDVIEEVIEEVEIDVEEEENSRGFEEVNVFNNVATEREEKNIEESNIEENPIETDACIENLRECKEYVDIKTHDLSGFHLA